MRRRHIKQLLLGTEETGGQRWANASSVTPGAMHAVAAVGVIMRRTLRPIGSAKTRKKPIQAAQIVCIQGERVTPKVLSDTDVRPAAMFLQLAVFCWTGRQNSWFQACFGNTAITCRLVGRRTGNFSTPLPGMADGGSGKSLFSCYTS